MSISEEDGLSQAEDLVQQRVEGADSRDLLGGNRTRSGPSIVKLPYDPDTIRRFLEPLMVHGGAIEFRVFKSQFASGNFITAADRYPYTIAGWYDNPNALALDAGRLKGISGYVTPNPVRRDLLARSYNKLTKVRDCPICMVRPVSYSRTRHPLRWARAD
jgi:hypothetical protein